MCFVMDKSSYFFMKGINVILKSSMREILFGRWFFYVETPSWDVFQWEFCIQVFCSAQFYIEL